jgi:VWFA-related protein
VDVFPTKGGQPVQDLTAADFEIYEDNKPQTVDSFEHVVIQSGGPQSERIEPSSQREMLQAAANPRNRVFVIFLDISHVGFVGSHDIAGPLLRMITRVLAPNDLLGVMTSKMSAGDLVLSRRTEVTEEQLRKVLPWGEKGTVARDDLEHMYEECGADARGMRVEELVARKRERAALEALQDLVRYLGAIREERKAVIPITEGWLLYGPDQSLTSLHEDPASRGLSDPVPTNDPVHVGPTGKLTTKDPHAMNEVSQSECWADRMRLAAMDDNDFMRQIINDANRWNLSFYPVDPRGLTVFDSDIGPAPPPSLTQDAKMLKVRSNSLHDLATGTDGIFNNQSNDLDGILKKVSDDLTSYYLLGYYSTNTKFDGTYRSLKVRVKRPGVEVRARRGYRAATAEEVSAKRKAADAPKAPITQPLNAALGALGNPRPDARLFLYATTAPGSDLLWIAGEFASTPGRSDEWGQGATTDIQVKAGGDPATTRVTTRAGEKNFITSVKLPPGQHATIDVQARSTPSGGSSPATETYRVAGTTAAIFYRRGPSTANRQVPTADLRFTRADRLHLEVPVAASMQPGAGRLLDRTGQPLPVPVTVAERTDAETGQKWIVADVILAPLAPADYGVEIGMTAAGTENRIIAGLRVVR